MIKNFKSPYQEVFISIVSILKDTLGKPVMTYVWYIFKVTWYFNNMKIPLKLLCFYLYNLVKIFRGSSKLDN